MFGSARLRRYALACAVALLLVAARASAQTEAQARAVAARFAPVFYQGLDEARHDYLTNFDFDGDWRGDNNWAHADDERFPLKAYVYYAVSETATHYFIHYAVFHPRDYKGGSGGRILSNIINEGVKRGGRFDPTGRSAEATVAHENDMEGCLVVVAKQGGDIERARVVYVETLAHNRFLKYTAATEDSANAASAKLEGGPDDDRKNADDGKNVVTLDGERPRLYVEPKGHGIAAYRDDKQRPRGSVLRYEYGGRAAVPAPGAETVSYDLVPLLTTLWPRAQQGVGETYGLVTDYGQVSVSVVGSKGRTQAHALNLGALGSAFLGAVGGHNMARPPWGWFDNKERSAAPGSWFFDPAATVKRHFKLGADFGVAYVRQPFLGVGAQR
ncbi:MAG TPA: hypothetical protein VF546_06580 [Pyrinomonadaceae bacterium]|jgi:hypothetical protein